jgi:hypothetical protein
VRPSFPHSPTGHEVQVQRDHALGLAGAQAAADVGDEEVARWVGDFLASPGSDNATLAAALAQEAHWWYGPVRLRVEDLERLAGPEPEVVCTEAPTVWEHAVDDMEEELDDGWEPPPLLAEWRDGRLLLQDGNHRHEALVRAGETEAWTLVYFSRLVDRDQFAHRHLEELRVSGTRP